MNAKEEQASTPYAFAEDLIIHIENLNGQVAQISDCQGRILGSTSNGFQVSGAGLYIVTSNGFKTKVLVK